MVAGKELDFLKVEKISKRISLRTREDFRSNVRFGGLDDLAYHRVFYW
jgi:hypothetical protein